MGAGGHQDQEQPAQPAQQGHFVEEEELNPEELMEREQHRRVVMNRRLMNLGVPCNIPERDRQSQARTYTYAYDHAIGDLGFEAIPRDAPRYHRDDHASSGDAYALVFSDYYTGARAHDPNISIDRVAWEAHAFGIVAAVDEELNLQLTEMEYAQFKNQVFNALNIQIPE